MKLHRLLLLATIVFFFGCSNDDDENVINGVDRTPNLQATGSSANDFLASSKYNTLVIEVFYVQDFRPNAQTLVNLKNFMEARLNKPGGVSIIEKEIASPGMAPYDINEIAQIESAIRTKYNAGNVLTMYMFFADGGTTTDTDSQFILGSAYRNTSFVMYESTIKTLSDGVGEPSRVDLETTVIQHELGHLLGLTNLGTPMTTNHEDSAHPKHCSNENCLMYWEADGSGLLGMMLGGNVPQLDADCLADLQANGGK
jgi:predicted Zn-dependent protease